MTARCPEDQSLRGFYFSYDILMTINVRDQLQPSLKHINYAQPPRDHFQRQVYRWLGRYQQWWIAPFILALMIALWESLVRWQQFPAFILPGPVLVWNKLLSMISDGSLFRHVNITMLEIGLGLCAGLFTALVLGYLLGKNRTIERVAAPYLVASQSIPIVAIAPLLVIWLGSGLASKVLICALIVFFPTLISTIVGIRNIDADQRSLMCSFAADAWQTFRYLELPAALPVIFGGLKLSAILAVVGAVVAEFMGADAGLGFLINLARGVLDTPLMFVAVICLVAIAQLLYLTLALIERFALAWQRQQE